MLEQEGGGVQLMTVHKAKGLEFPVVILADLTAKLTGPQGADRTSDAESRLCAQRLLWCAPWELLDAAEAEAKADKEEALRVAYVAATRARDLLVVAAIGEEERAGGWLSPLHDALYPPKDRWRAAAAAPGCPPFGGCTVLNRPPENPEEVSVTPGLHSPKAGAHQVVWFDPAVLGLRRRNGWRGARGRPQGTAAQGRRLAALPAMARHPPARIARGKRRVSAPRTGGDPGSRGGHGRSRGDDHASGSPAVRAAGSSGAWHDILQHADVADEWKRSPASGAAATAPASSERTAAVEVVRAALAHPCAYDSRPGARR